MTMLPRALMTNKLTIQIQTCAIVVFPTEQISNRYEAQIGKSKD